MSNDDATSGVPRGEKGDPRPHHRLGFSIEHRMIMASNGIHPEKASIYYKFLQHHSVLNKLENPMRRPPFKALTGRQGSRPQSIRT